jgi:hypothetical protein
VPGCRNGDAEGARLPRVPPQRILRFDTRKLYEVVNELRRERQLSWAETAAEIGVSAPVVTNLSRGGRTGFPQVMRLVRWLRVPAADFVRVSSR